MKQITIYELLPLLKKGFVSMDKDCEWCWFSSKPYKRTDMWILRDLGDWQSLTRAFDIAPFDGDWKDSLIECGESAIIKNIRRNNDNTVIQW